MCKLKTGSGRDICTPVVYIVAIFTIPRRWKQPKCLSTDEWRNKMWRNKIKVLGMDGGDDLLDAPELCMLK